METANLMQTCAMCGGQFPGPGIEQEGKVYCCDKCANHQHKIHKVTAKVPKIASIMGLGVLIGYLVGRKRNRFFN